MPSLKNAKDILEAYSQGVRHFQDISLDGESFDGQNLENVVFERCFLYSSFRNASLKGAIFLNGNIKTCDFAGADLTNAHFEGLVVDGAQFEGAKTSGLVFNNNYCFGQLISLNELLK